MAAIRALVKSHFVQKINANLSQLFENATQMENFFHYFFINNSVLLLTDCAR